MGMSDLEWMELAGRSGHLAITHDLHILDVPGERAALESWRLGAIFVDAGQATRWRVLRLLLDRWEWLEQIDTATARPFAFRLSLEGRIREVRL